MDDVRPWIIKKIVEGPLKRLETESILDNRTASVLPPEPFCTQKLQFDRFQSPHRWGSQGPVWAEASDRDVVIGYPRLSLPTDHPKVRVRSAD
ncbi:hypothetical protein PGT21_013389 [Puccinia graminis f. sp. tritici]|uniref:Uncharacterized protein n=1 Tax=Puccinia graminis f. sp. tritici TaxID=56615 RepID=A0A5B0QT17_PUCGR|nr:hypothetical protein PGT21_013389 [Puccinia graminis f. sp. tritici]